MQHLETACVDSDLDGFLSPSVEDVIELVRTRYKEWLTVYSAINRFAVRAQHNLQVHQFNLQELFAATLFARTVANVQASIILCERGMETQARIMLRAGMDSLFSLVAISKNPELAEDFAAADEIERRRMLTRARTWVQPELKAKADATATDEKLAEIEASIREKGAKVISSKEMAVMAGLEDWYQTAYAVFSGTVHASARDLERHLVVGADGTLEELRSEPTIEHLNYLILTGSEILLVALDAIASVFGYPIEPFRGQQQEVLGTLADKSEELAAPGRFERT